MSDKIITFLGCGSWGAALGVILADKGFSVRYWHRSQSAVKKMISSRKHYLLDNIIFNENVSFFSQIDTAVSEAQYIVLAVIRSRTISYNKDHPKHQLVLSAESKPYKDRHRENK